MTSTQFNKPMLKELRMEIDTALKAVATKHGLQFYGIGRIRFDSVSFRTQLEMTTQTPKQIGTLTSFPFKIGDDIQVGTSKDIFKVIRFSRQGLPVIQSPRGKLYRLSSRTWPTCRAA